MNWQAVLDRCHGGKQRMGRQHAHEIAERLNRDAYDGRPVGAYRCPCCAAYHVGHVPSMEGLQSIADAIRARAQGDVIDLRERSAVA